LSSCDEKPHGLVPAPVQNKGAFPALINLSVPNLKNPSLHPEKILPLPHRRKGLCPFPNPLKFLHHLIVLIPPLEKVRSKTENPAPCTLF